MTDGGEGQRGLEGSRADGPGQGSAPGLEDQSLAAATGKPAQVPGVPGGDGPNADAFDTSEATEALRAVPGEGPADPREMPDPTDPGEGENP